MSLKTMDKLQNIETGDFAYRGLYKAGAIAALMATVLFRRNLDAEWMLLFPISISAVFLLVWYILVGVRLWVLDLHRTAGALRAAVSSDGGVLHMDNVSQPL